MCADLERLVAQECLGSGPRPRQVSANANASRPARLEVTLGEEGPTMRGWRGVHGALDTSSWSPIGRGPPPSRQAPSPLLGPPRRSVSSSGPGSSARSTLTGRRRTIPRGASPASDRSRAAYCGSRALRAARSPRPRGLMRLQHFATREDPDDPLPAVGVRRPHDDQLPVDELHPLVLAEDAGLHHAHDVADAEASQGAGGRRAHGTPSG